MKRLLAVIALIAFILCNSTVALAAKKSSKLYKIDITEKLNDSEEMQSLNEKLGENFHYTGYIVLDNKSDEYILVYSENLARKAVSDSKLFDVIYQTEGRGFDHGSYTYKKGNLSLSGDEYSKLFEGRIGSEYSEKNDAETLQLTSKVTEMN